MPLGHKVKKSQYYNLLLTLEGCAYFQGENKIRKFDKTHTNELISALTK
jgi:hypothetical protein